MTPRSLLVLAVGLLACGRDSFTAPRDDSNAGGEQQPLEIRLPAGRAETLLAGDTVTLTATAVDEKSRELTSGVIEWLHPWIVSVGPRNGLLKVPSTTTEVVAVLKRPGFSDVHGRATISAKRFPGIVFVWTPGVSIVQVPTPDGAREVGAAAINDRGEVVGTAEYGDRSEGFIWSQQLGYRALSATLPSRSTYANDISENGTVVGSIRHASGRFTAFVWSIEKGMIEIDGGASQKGIAFVGINAGGRVLGSRFGTGFGRGFLWTESSGIQDLVPTPSPDAILQPLDINDNDDVLLSSDGKYWSNVDWGFAWPSDAALLTAGRMIKVECGECALSDMNNARVIAGNILEPRNGFRWTTERGLEPLAPGPGSSSEVFAINDSGVVAGAIFLRETFWRTSATIWRGEEVVVIPNQWGVRATVARDINNRGQVLVVVR